MYKREIELHRSNISSKQFFTYCNKMAEKKDICLEAFLDYDYWADQSHSREYEEYKREWGKEANKTMPYEVVMYVKDEDNRYMYHFILEWNDEYGYCYIKEEGI